MNGTYVSVFNRLTFVCIHSVRLIRHKPWIPKFRLLRQMQPWDNPIDINADRPPEFLKETPSALRARLRRNGLLPPLLFMDTPINLGHSGQVTDPYVPPEGDGRASILSRKHAAKLMDDLTKKGKSYMALRKIKAHEPTFKPTTFVNEAESIYLEALELLQNFTIHESRLLELVTEKAFLEMTKGLRFRTLQWQFVGSVEPPRVVRIRTQEHLTKDNFYGQVTVRFHTQQVLAIYDRFGRLLFGTPSLPVDVLEYVVLEKHITDEYGIWRLHARIPSPDTASFGPYIPTQRLALEPASHAPNQPAIPDTTAPPTELPVAKE